MSEWKGAQENQRKGWEAATKHGQSGTPAYRSWHKMLQRCTNPNNKHWPNYGGRGIAVCDRWKYFSNFFADMGPRPQGTTIDRINNDGNYEPENCRWTTRKKQQNNTRRNRLLTFNGLTATLSEWAERIGLTPQALKHRLDRGWSIDRALTDGKCLNQWQYGERTR